MPIAETLTSIALALAPVFAEALAESLLDKTLSAKVVAKLGGLYADRVKQMLGEDKAATQLRTLGKQVAAQVASQHRAALERLPENERLAVVEEVGVTLTQANLSADWLVRDLRLTPERLLTHLQQRRVEGLATDSRRVYDALLKDCAPALTRVAQQLPHYQTTMDAVTLQDLDQILILFNRFFAAPTAAALKFEADYRAEADKKWNRLELLGVQRLDTLTRRQQLLRAYTALQIEMPTDEKTATHAPEFAAERLARSGPQIGSAEAVLASASHVMLTGEAGSGKTTLLRWVAVQMVNRHFAGELAGWNELVPFYVPLRSCVQAGVVLPPPEQFIAYTNQTLLAQMPAQWAHDQLENGRAVVLIDGVDEVPQAQRPRLLELLQELVGRYPHNRYVISSRPSAVKAEDWPEWGAWLNEAQFASAALQRMTPEQTQQFIQQWYAALSDTVTEPDEKLDLAPQPAALSRLLAQRPALHRLAATPLLCAMICALYRERGQTLPAERLKLYAECVEMLLSRRDEARKVQATQDYAALNDSQKLALARHLAYKMRLNNATEISAAQAEDWLSQKFAELALPPTFTAAHARRFLVERANLLREPSLGQLDFAHRNFQDFLAAQALVEAGDFGLLRDKAHDEQWREVVIVAAGLARPKERDDLLQALLQRGSDATDDLERKRLWLLAAACLETCTELAPATRAAVLAAAAALIPPQDEDEIALFAAAGDPLIPLLAHHPDYSDKDAARCVQTLLRLGTPAILPELARYAQARTRRQHPEQEWWKLKNKNREVLNALGKGWAQFDRAIYAREVLHHSEAVIIRALTGGPTDGLEHLTETHYLDVRGSPLQTLEGLADLPQLQHLNLSGTQVTDAELPVLAALTQLQDLDLSSTQVTDAGLPVLAALTQLQDLDLSNTQVTDAGLPVLRALTQLQALYLFNTSVTDAGLSALAVLTQLRDLDLRGTEVTDAGLSALAVLTQLRYLNLRHTEVTDAGLPALAALTQLQRLELINTKVTDAGLPALAALTQLQDLDLFGTGVTDAGLPALAALTQLQHLQLSRTKVTDSEVAQLKRRLPNLIVSRM